MRRLSAQKLLLAVLFVWSPLAANDQIVRLELSPPEIELASKRSTARLVLTGVTEAGEVRDLTQDAEWRTKQTRIARVENGTVVPRSNGRTEIVVRAAGLSITAPVLVRRFDEKDSIRFHGDVLAVLTKQGCNQGSCHGSPQGKGGFSLSLLAYAPSIDRHSLVREDRGRRIDLLDPAQSLFLRKPTLRVPHKGGRRLKEGKLAFEVLRQWVHEGATTDFENEARCVELVVSPSATRVLRFHNAKTVKQQLRVVAKFADGTSRDVTELSSYETSHHEIAEVDERGLVTGKTRGQAAISVRYLDHVQAVRFTLVRDVTGFTWNRVEDAVGNSVDRLVNEKLRLLQVPTSALCSDSVFVRRVHLDLTGLLPTIAETKALLNDREGDKRARLIERLLKTDAYARFWGQKRADLLRVNNNLIHNEAALGFGAWIVKTVKDNLPLDQFARQILTVTGTLKERPETAYFFTTDDTTTLTETTAQLFMGSRVNCAKCHNHPFEAWTQNDYYRIAAVFARLGTDGNPKKSLDSKISNRESGEVHHPSSRRVMKPWPVSHHEEGAAAEPAERRERFTNWLTAKDNPYFARVEVNRMWAELFGRGIVEPVDDFRGSNPPANAELLDWLAKELVESGFDRKHILRLLLNSRAYQRSTETLELNREDASLASHMTPRLLTAEQLHDALLRVAREFQDDADIVKRGVTQHVMPERIPFLVTFGSPERRSPCACDRPNEPTLPQILQLLNGKLVDGYVRKATGRYEKLEDPIGELYLAAFSRKPKPSERQNAEAYLASKTQRGEALQDLIWAIVNTKEFLFQH
ncbi:MAG: DUF1553 domain-containing protein [Planctomycetota bacterium]